MMYTWAPRAQTCEEHALDAVCDDAGAEAAEEEAADAVLVHNLPHRLRVRHAAHTRLFRNLNPE
jgi:hypothetical protein